MVGDRFVNLSGENFSYNSLMIYYFQREIFTLWEATSSDYFPSGQIDHLELPIVIGSN